MVTASLQACQPASGAVGFLFPAKEPFYLPFFFKGYGSSYLASYIQKRGCASEIYLF